MTVVAIASSWSGCHFLPSNTAAWPAAGRRRPLPQPLVAGASRAAGLPEHSAPAMRGDGRLPFVWPLVEPNVASTKGGVEFA